MQDRLKLIYGNTVNYKIKRLISCYIIIHRCVEWNYYYYCKAEPFKNTVDSQCLP